MYRTHLCARASQALTAPLDLEFVMRDVINFTVIRTDGEVNFPMTREQQLAAIDSYLDGGDWHKVSVTEGECHRKLHFDMSTITEDECVILIEEEMTGEDLRDLVARCRDGIWCERSQVLSLGERYDNDVSADADWYLEEFFGES